MQTISGLFKNMCKSTGETICWTLKCWHFSKKYNPRHVAVLFLQLTHSLLNVCSVELLAPHEIHYFCTAQIVNRRIFVVQMSFEKLNLDTFWWSPQCTQYVHKLARRNRWCGAMGNLWKIFKWSWSYLQSIYKWRYFHHYASISVSLEEIFFANFLKIFFTFFSVSTVESHEIEKFISNA